MSSVGKKRSFIRSFLTAGEKWAIGLFFTMLTVSLGTITTAAVGTLRMIKDNNTAAALAVIERQKIVEDVAGISAANLRQDSTAAILAQNQAALICSVRKLGGEPCMMKFKEMEN